MISSTDRPFGLVPFSGRLSTGAVSCRFARTDRFLTWIDRRIFFPFRRTRPPGLEVGHIDGGPKTHVAQQGGGASALGGRGHARPRGSPGGVVSAVGGPTRVDDS